MSTAAADEKRIQLLENATVEYATRYGLTKKARIALTHRANDKGRSYFWGRSLGNFFKQKVRKS